MYRGNQGIAHCDLAGIACADRESIALSAELVHFASGSVLQSDNGVAVVGRGLLRPEFGDRRGVAIIELTHGLSALARGKSLVSRLPPDLHKVANPDAKKPAWNGLNDRQARITGR